MGVISYWKRRYKLVFWTVVKLKRCIVYYYMKQGLVSKSMNNMVLWSTRAAQGDGVFVEVIIKTIYFSGCIQVHIHIYLYQDR